MFHFNLQVSAIQIHVNVMLTVLLCRPVRLCQAFAKEHSNLYGVFFLLFLYILFKKMGKENNFEGENSYEKPWLVREWADFAVATKQYGCQVALCHYELEIINTKFLAY